MRHDFLDRYSRLESFVHSQPAGLKLGGTVALVAATVILPFSPATGAIAALLLVVLAVSRIPVMFVIRRLLLFEPVIAGIAVLNLLRPGGGAVMLSIMAKSSVCLLAMILLANTTPFASLLDVLRRLRFPGLLVTMFALMYRYVFVLIDEAERMHRARRSRTYVERRGLAWRLSGILIGQLFLRSSERAERIYAAMCSRGWR